MYLQALPANIRHFCHLSFYNYNFRLATGILAYSFTRYDYKELVLDLEDLVMEV